MARQKKRTKNKNAGPTHNTKLQTTEAAFESELRRQILLLFPNLEPSDIKEQLTFRVVLGNRSYDIDGRSENVRSGRLDMLIQWRGNPLAILELKKPGQHLTSEDEDQARSYARLLNPMPPLYIVSNGNLKDGTRFFVTMTGKKWDSTDRSAAGLRSLFTEASRLANQQLDEAVCHLLGQNPEWWQALIREHTEEEIAGLQEPANELTRPLMPGFSIPRKVTEELEGLLYSGKRAIALVGPALCGKTNIISEFCRKHNSSRLVPFFVDFASSAHSIIERLAQLFHREYFRYFRVEEVKQWIMNGLIRPESGRLVIIIDGISGPISEALRAEIDALWKLSERSAVSFVLALTSFAFDDLTRQPGRSYLTALGRSLRKVNVPETLDDEEYNAAMELFLKWKIQFNHGAQLSIEYRLPRVLRLVLTVISSNPEPNCLTVLPAVPSVDFLANSWRAYACTPELRQEWRALAQAYLRELESPSDPERRLATYGEAYVTRQSVIGQIDNLLNHGWVETVEMEGLGSFELVKLPEVLVAAYGHLLSENLRQEYSSMGCRKAYRLLVDSTDPLPLGDVTAAYTLLMAKRNAGEEMISELVRALIDDPPHYHEMTGGSKWLVQVPRHRPLALELDHNLTADDLGQTISNIHPYMILAHLAGIGIVDETGEPNMSFEILKRIGSHPGILRRRGMILKKMGDSHLVHDLPGIGEIPCYTQGIIEPGMESMLACGIQFPEKLIELVQWATDNNKHTLISRLIAVVRIMEENIDAKVKVIAQTLIPILEQSFSAGIEESIRSKRSSGTK